MTHISITLSNVGKPTPCALCRGEADPGEDGFAAVAYGDELVCDTCLAEHAPDIARLLAGYRLDSATTDDWYGTNRAWANAFYESGLLSLEHKAVFK